jgi:hypothetical protein
MKKWVLLGSVAIAVLGAITYFLFSRNGAEAGSVGIHYRKRWSFEKVFFTVTNGGRVAINAHRVQVQILQNGLWVTVDDRPPVMSPVLEPGAAKVNHHALWEPGEKWDIVVADPDEKPWRVILGFTTEQKGFDAFKLMARISWKRRRLTPMPRRIFSQQSEAVSDDIRK